MDEIKQRIQQKSSYTNDEIANVLDDVFLLIQNELSPLIKNYTKQRDEGIPYHLLEYEKEGLLVKYYDKNENPFFVKSSSIDWELFNQRRLIIDDDRNESTVISTEIFYKWLRKNRKGEFYSSIESLSGLLGRGIKRRI